MKINGQPTGRLKRFDRKLAPAPRLCVIPTRFFQAGPFAIDVSETLATRVSHHSPQRFGVPPVPRARGPSGLYSTRRDVHRRSAPRTVRQPWITDFARS